MRRPRRPPRLELGGSAWGSGLDVRDAEACRRPRRPRRRARGHARRLGQQRRRARSPGTSGSTTTTLRRTLFEVNSLGTINGSLAALEPMRAAGRGHLINVVSLAGLGAPPGEALYAATKHARDGVHARHARRPAPRRASARSASPPLPGRDLDADAPRQARRPRRGTVVLGHAAAGRGGRRARSPACSIARAWCSTIPRWRGGFVRLFDAMPGPRDAHPAAVDARRTAPPGALEAADRGRSRSLRGERAAAGERDRRGQGNEAECDQKGRGRLPRCSAPVRRRAPCPRRGPPDRRWITQLVASVAVPAGATRSRRPNETVLTGATSNPATAIITASATIESTNTRGRISAAWIALRSA